MFERNCGDCVLFAGKISPAFRTGKIAIQVGPMQANVSRGCLRWKQDSITIDKF